MNVIPENLNYTHDLLKNFIGTDDDEISLHVGTANLTYSDPNIGIDKSINIDTSVSSHYFKLQGPKAKYYRLSKDNIPKIQSNITQRELDVSFDYVEKIYDGSDDFTPQIRKLMLDKGYYFYDVTGPENNYNHTNIVHSISEITSVPKRIQEEYIYFIGQSLDNKYKISRTNVLLNDFYITLDGYEGYTLVNEDSSEAEVIFDIKYDIFNITEDEARNITVGKTIRKGLFYYTKSFQSNTGTTTKYIAMDSTNSYAGKKLVTPPITKEFVTKNECLDWLNALHHQITSVILEKNSDDDVFINFNTLIDIDYIVKENVFIRYTYEEKNPNTVEFVSSDAGKVKVNFETATINGGKNVTDEIRNITIDKIMLVGDTLGDASGNYKLMKYSSTGKILKRTINAYIKCLDKYYDGSIMAPFESDKSVFKTGFENIIESDDISINIDYKGDPMDETHYFTGTGRSTLIFDSPDVGTNKLVSIGNISLEGNDICNYKLGNVLSTFRANILPRPIDIKINKIRFIRSSKTWELDYEFENDIKTDNLSINNNIVVYGGIDSSGKSIHNNTSISDIISLFFNYNFNPNYRFKNIEDNEIKTISNSKQNFKETYIYTEDARPAEPNTIRRKVNTSYNDNYEGNVKQVSEDVNSSDEIINHVYFESENKAYKIYSGCKVRITNISLNLSNPKAKNYSFNRHDYTDVILEIV